MKEKETWNVVEITHEKVTTIPVTYADNIKNAIFQTGTPVILGFFAEWCGPCRMIAPVMESIAEEHPEIKVFKIDVDKNQDLVRQFHITSIPTLIAFKNGKLIDTMIGYQPKEKVLKMFYK